MTDSPYSARQLFWQRLASLQVVAWICARLLPGIDRAMFRLSGRRTTLTAALSGLPITMLTTTGARSGLRRSVPLVYIRDDQDAQRLVLVGSNFGQPHLPAWYYNLKANPRAECVTRGVRRVYSATEASEETYQRLWQRAQRTYLGFTLYRQRITHRHIPIMILTPVERDERV